ncbi:Dipeptide transport system permease protein DppC (TC 3.A.1.5.2) [Olavius algarvensis Delta 1 endosymbiont]|nr:Dipeptide transport system permease protein DppC (TC 3.A.1.5.2) [Olavius algarvensis Delta 1 endosymbiont]
MNTVAKLQHLGTETYHVFNRNKTSWVGLVLLLIMVILAILAPVIAPHNPVEQNIIQRLQPPSDRFLLGTDYYGRDVLSRIIWGCRVSFVIGSVSVAAAMLLGTLLGSVAGYKGGYLDSFVMGVMDVLMSIPTLLMGLLIVAILGPSQINLIIALALTMVPRFARIARAPTIAAKNKTYVEACQAMGFSDIRVLVVHIFPNILGELLVMGSMWMATAVRTEAALSFIGLGVKPPTATLGGMIREGFKDIMSAPWASLYPGLVILLIVFAANLLGDGLRDALDPKLRSDK